MQCFLRLLAASLVALSLATEGGIRGYKEDGKPRKDSKVKFMDLEYFTRSEVDELLVKIAADDARITSLEEAGCAETQIWQPKPLDFCFSLRDLAEMVAVIEDLVREERGLCPV
eukprot:Skav225837  [mRNA]  locus=scaffold345:84996:87065:+ [translate_table: standard]